MKILERNAKECERQKLVPFEDKKTTNKNKETKEITDEYSCLNEIITKTLVIDNTKIKDMILNVLLSHLLKKLLIK